MVLITTDTTFGSLQADRAGPKTEFAEIARLAGAGIESFTSGCARHGPRFKSLFNRWPKIGAALHATILAGKCGAIYVTGEDLGLPLAVFLRLRRWRGRLICVFHNLTPRKRLLMRLLGEATFYRLITVSDRQRALLIREVGIDASRVVSVRNWVDTNFFQPDPQVLDGEYLIACGAENRDYATLAAAARLTPHSVKIFGHGFLNAVRDKREALPGNVELCPRVAYDVLRSEYAGATGVVIPLNSVDYAAGVTGLVEAMAMGKPIIVTQSIGIAEYLDAARPGIEVEPGNAAALAKAIDTLTSNPPKFAAVAKRNRDWVVQHCSLQAYARLVASLMTDP